MGYFRFMTKNKWQIGSIGSFGSFVCVPNVGENRVFKVFPPRIDRHLPDGFKH